MSEWQPIETAPKDGTKILALCQPRYFENGKPMPFNYINVVWWRPAKDNKWGEARWKHTLTDSYAEPTHWRPLPAPPVGDGSSPAKSGPV